MNGFIHCKIQKNILSILSFAALFTLITACGRTDVPASATADAENAAYDWQKNGFATSPVIREEQSLWAAEYLPWEHTDISDDFSKSQMMDIGIVGDELLSIFPVHEGDGEAQYLLDRYDLIKGESGSELLELSPFGFHNGILVGAGNWGEQGYVLRVLERERNGENAFQTIRHSLLYVGPDGNTKLAELLPALRELDLPEDSLDLNGVFCDDSGRSFLRILGRQQAYQELLILDSQGKYLSRYRAGEDERILEPMRMENGEIVFPIQGQGSQETRFVWFEDAFARELAVLRDSSFFGFCGRRGNDLYYMTYGGIADWNVSSGKRTEVYRDGRGVLNLSAISLYLPESGDPVLRITNWTNGELQDRMAILSPEEARSGEAVRIVSLVDKNSSDAFAVERHIGLLSNQDWLHEFQYETSGTSSLEDYRSRILAEMAAGGGPDILLVSRGDMAVLQQAGYLAALMPLLPPEEVEKLLPSVLELGSVGGTLTGLAPLPHYTSCATLREIWEGDHWTMGDILGLLETGAFESALCQDITDPLPFAPYGLLMVMANLGVQDGTLIDWEAGESLFDGDEFKKMLVCAGTYGKSSERRETSLGSGGSVGIFISLDSGVEALNELYGMYREEYRLVGEPTAGASGNYVHSDAFFAVNRNSQNTEAIASFFSYFLSDSFQIEFLEGSGYLMSARWVRAEDLIFQETASGTEASWRGRPVLIKEDGKTTLDDFRAYQETVAAQPEAHPQIDSIIREEVQSYFAGQKSAEEVARIIDSRVQLYLDEGNR